MNDMSMTITPSRAASCSARQWSNHGGRDQVRASATGDAPAGRYQSAPSHPLTSLKRAPASASRACTGDTLAPRAVCIDRLG